MSTWPVIVLGWMVLLAGSGSAKAQDPSVDPVPVTTEADTAAARTSIAPLPVLFYTPETKLALGGLLNVFRRERGADETRRPSTFAPVLIYTFNSQWIAFLSGNHYWAEERNQVLASVSYSKFPDLFYGVGNENAEDSDEDFTFEVFGAEAAYLRQMWPDIWIGPSVSAAHSSILETEEGRRLDGGEVPGSDGGTIVAVGVSASVDSRDDITFPRGGMLHTISTRRYDGLLGSDFDFTQVSLDGRLYRPLGSEGALALRVLGIHTEGEVPFQVLPALGGDALLRGYYAGRFRDNNLLAGQVEFRGRLWKRWGGAVFAGAGQVAPRLDALGSSSFHGSGGLSVRFLLVPEESLYLRLDLGWGEDSSGTYISLGEAF